MTDNFHAGPCPGCRQGRLFLYRNAVTGTVYGHCEECEWGYASPDRLAAKDGFLTLLEEEDAEPASEEDIRRSAWANGRIFVAHE
ncbi:hypothetical protein FZC33_07910 [Labrys sp. KNU-23]|uniref:hypothetical protein n=1 Tax=Labrys sp. KNU-23 TaxID=2789216 RepID=UPI0011ED6688|nr:hypothetical protein [Labrys sp. KNU-23]QEN86106.1 hypothetical protein FZC33_07910 [Labrys sp. KNU-23]